MIDPFCRIHLLFKNIHARKKGVELSHELEIQLLDQFLPLAKMVVQIALTDPQLRSNAPQAYPGQSTGVEQV